MPLRFGVFVGCIWLLDIKISGEFEFIFVLYNIIYKKK
eukprot:SAG11_NODE_48749_length_121_cov_423.545455_1_plen_37_part_01